MEHAGEKTLTYSGRSLGETATGLRVGRFCGTRYSVAPFQVEGHEMVA